MKVLQERDILKLRKERNITNIKGEELKPALLHRKPKTPLTSEERQAQALEKLVSEITLILQANDKNASILMQMISKMQMNIRIPEYPEPAKKWEHTLVRGGDGKTKKIISERV